MDRNLGVGGFAVGIGYINALNGIYQRGRLSDQQYRNSPTIAAMANAN